VAGIMVEGDWGHAYRIDRFNVPAPVREAFLARVHATNVFLETLPGFVQHLIFEQSGTEVARVFVTVAIWETEAAIEAARPAVADWHAQMGFAPGEMSERLGVDAEIGVYARIDTDDRLLPA